MKLTPRTMDRLERDFGISSGARAVYVIESVDVGDGDTQASERIQTAMLIVAHGNLDRLSEAAALAETDWRDLLVNAELADGRWRGRVESYLARPETDRVTLPNAERSGEGRS